MKFGLTERTINTIIEILSKHEQVDHATIFGSRANGKYREESDIDICIYGDISVENYTNITMDFFDSTIPYEVDLIIFNSLQDNDKLKENILKEEVVIYERR